MGVVPVDVETGEVISAIARKLRVSREEVIRMLVNGEIGEVGIGDEMNPEMEKKMAELMKNGDSKSVIDKMMELKMMERLENSGAEKKGSDMSELMEIMKVKMMMEAMQSKNNQSIDPNMLMMMMLMKNNDGTKTDMTKVIEAMTKSINTKDSSTAELLKELLNEKKEDEKEQELMAVIEEQNRMIEELKRQQEEIRKAMMYQQRDGRERRKPPEEDIINSVQKIEKMKDTFERVGLIKPPSAEDREIAIKQDVVKAKADLERETMQTQAEITKDLMKGIDSKFDKVLTIVETLLKQPPAQREQTLEEFQRRGQITPQERQQIYAQMQQQVAMQQAQMTPQAPPEANEIDGIGMKARQMWEQGYDATTIAKTLHIPITQTYQYRPKEGQ